MKTKNETFLIKFAKRILSALKRREFKLYSNKFSKKTYTLHQHIVLLALREYQKGIGFRQFCKLLPDFNLLLKYIGLDQIPHFTTLHKVSCRLKGSLLEDLFLGFVSKGKIRSGIDSTGLSLQHSTYYYEKRLEHFRKAKKPRKIGRPRKNHRNKAETIMFVIKKVFGEHINAIKAKNQRNQTRFRIIAYNAYRLISYFIWSISTAPCNHKL